jgi:hypothetical protein
VLPLTLLSNTATTHIHVHFRELLGNRSRRVLSEHCERQTGSRVRIDRKVLSLHLNSCASDHSLCWTWQAHDRGAAAAVAV